MKLLVKLLILTFFMTLSLQNMALANVTAPEGFNLVQPLPPTLPALGGNIDTYLTNNAIQQLPGEVLRPAVVEDVGLFRDPNGAWDTSTWVISNGSVPPPDYHILSIALSIYSTPPQGTNPFRVYVVFGANNPFLGYQNQNVYMRINAQENGVGDVESNIVEAQLPQALPLFNAYAFYIIVTNNAGTILQTVDPLLLVGSPLPVTGENQSLKVLFGIGAFLLGVKLLLKSSEGRRRDGGFLC